MRIKKLFAIAAVGALAACQHTTPVQQRPQAADPGPPSAQQGAAAQQPQQPQARMRSNAQQQARRTPAPAQSAGAGAAAQQSQSQVVITFHLAQQKQEEGLVPVEAGGDAPLFALPQPVLTQADMQRVTPVRAPDKSEYVLFEMNQAAAPKLRTITERAKGHYLLLSVGGQLASVVQIGDPITDGRLLVSTQGPDHTQAILRLLKGG